MRNAPNKTVGYVVIPLFLDQRKEESIEEALERSDFVEVANVVNAIREQDDLLIDIIRELCESKGRGEVFNPRRLRDSVQVIGPAISLDTIADAIDIQLIERLGTSWDEMIGRLIAYRQQYGDCLVPKTYSDKQFANWVGTQRNFKKSGTLKPARIQQLEELGFSWDPFAEYWDEMFGRLVTYKQQHGDCLVQRNYSDKKLASWVNGQRTDKKSGKLNSLRIQQLDVLGFSWEPISEYWEEMFHRLVAYRRQHGDCLVPRDYSDTFLARWVNLQRVAKSRGNLDLAHVQQLDELGFVWNAREESWEDMFGLLVAYRQQHGDCLVTRSYGDKTLANWVNIERTLNNSGKMEISRERRLNEVGFVWHPHGKNWKDMFGQLVAYKQEHGDCLVPANYSDKSFAGWVLHQRQFKKSARLDASRERRLNELGFVWNARDESWEEMFCRLVAYKVRFNNCLLPRDYVDRELASWVHVLRNTKRKGILSAARIQQLEELGFVWNTRDEAWDDVFGRLVAYKQMHGHCRVPRSYSDKHLADWVVAQRSFKSNGKLQPSRIQRLNEVGFSWDPIGESWEEMFRRLVAYEQKHGDCLVPFSYSDKLLGHWVSEQRKRKLRGLLKSSQLQRLKKLRFSWDPISEYWENMFGRLVAYKLQHRDCLVPLSYGDKQLATWVATQRLSKNRGKLDPVRLQQLEALGFVWKV